jgi:hypothetical protein
MSVDGRTDRQTGKRTIVTYHAVLSILLSFPPSCIKIFYSVLCYKMLPICFSKSKLFSTQFINRCMKEDPTATVTTVRPAQWVQALCPSVKLHDMNMAA